MGARVATASAIGTSTTAVAEIERKLRTSMGTERPELVLVFASTQQPLAEVVPPLSQRLPDATVLGASTAGELTEQGDTKNGVAAIAIGGDVRARAGMAEGLSDDVEGAVQRATAPLAGTDPQLPYRTAILLLDPLAGNGEEATLLTASHLGPDVPLAGGAAGDDLAMKTTHVACGERAASNALVVAELLSATPLGIGVCHGHRALSDPVQVTRASGNVVYELDGRPAWEVWQEKTREHAATLGLDPASLSDDDVGGYLLRYEAGLASGQELKIRAPLSRDEDGSLFFACGIPEGSNVRITESEPERQVRSAREAARRARQGLGQHTPAGGIVFDCICRNLILGEQFGNAVTGISDELGGTPLAGFETYGEIALEVGDMSGFHNTTTVVLALSQ